MKKIQALILTACALFMVSCGNEIDKALDDYEDAVEQAIPLMKKAAEGDQNAATELKELSEKAAKAQETLDEMKEEMSDEQKERFTNIYKKTKL